MKIKILLIACLSLFIANIEAAPIASLYDARVAVTDRSEQVRNKAFPKGLQQVLIKVTGNPNVINVPSIKKFFTDSSSYVQSYNYSTINNNLFLEIKFNQTSIVKILNDAKQTKWGNDRASVLFLLDIADSQGEAILGDNTDKADILKEVAYEYGIPIILPMMDLDETAKTNLNDIKNFNMTAVQDFTKKYNPDAMLIGNLSFDAKQNWQGKWKLFLHDVEISSGNISAADLVQAFSKIHDAIINKLVPKNAPAVAESSVTKITLTIKGANDLGKYGEVVKYLNSLNVVNKVEPIDIGGSSVKLQLEINIPLFKFSEILKTDKLDVIDIDDVQNNINCQIK